MYEWSDEHLMIRDAVRDFVEREVRPRREELEFGDTPPYDLIRSLFRAFGVDTLAREQFKRRIEKEKLAAEGKEPEANPDAGPVGNAAMTTIPITSCAGARRGW